MAQRNTKQPISYTATYASDPMTPEAFVRVQRYLARLLAQTLVACPDLLGMDETEAGVLVPATLGIALPGDFVLPDDLLPDATPLLAMAQDFSEADLQLACNAAARQGSGFRSSWVQWLAKQVTQDKGCRLFAIPALSPASAPEQNTMLYRATHPHDRPYYRPRGEWFRQYAKQSDDILATLRRTA